MTLTGGSVSAGTGTTDGGNFTNSGIGAWTAASPTGPGWTVSATKVGASLSAPWWWDSTKPGLYWE
jgi:hypothetical protein